MNYILKISSQQLKAMTKRFVQAQLPYQFNVTQIQTQQSVDSGKDNDYLGKALQIITIVGSVFSGLVFLLLIAKYGKLERWLKKCFKYSDNKVNPSENNDLNDGFSLSTYTNVIQDNNLTSINQQLHLELIGPLINSVRTLVKAYQTTFNRLNLSILRTTATSVCQWKFWRTCKLPSSPYNLKACLKVHYTSVLTMDPLVGRGGCRCKVIQRA